MLKIENTTNVCDICTSNPSTVYCRADLAYLCSACDARIHAANQVAARHERVPVPTVAGVNYGDALLSTKEEDESFYDDDETASWLFGGGGDVDEYLDLDDYNSCQNSQFSEECNNYQQYYSVSQKNYGFEMNYQNAKDEVEQHIFDEASNTGYNCSVSMSHTVSLSQMDVGVVPESTISENSISHHNRPPKGITELFSGNQIPVPTQLTPMDREARVLRYREKKKTRKFEKTIRYASRKAYAETRPRIKGRFAKRTDSESEVDQMFSSSMMAESVYGVVPTF